MFFVMRITSFLLLIIFSTMFAMQQDQNNGRFLQLLPYEPYDRAIRAIDHSNIHELETLFDDNNAVMELDEDDFEELIQHSESIEEAAEFSLNNEASRCRSGTSIAGVTALGISTGAFITDIPLTVFCAKWGVCAANGWGAIAGAYGFAALSACIGVALLYKYACDTKKLHDVVATQPAIRRLIEHNQEDNVSTDETSSETSSGED